jgi:L-lysine 6-transaminase
MRIERFAMKQITPQQVIPVLTRHMLVDGYSDVVVDLEKSAGNYLVNALDGRSFLDLFSFFASAPIGLGHPKLADAAFVEELLQAGVIKTSNSDFYTTHMAGFVDTFSQYAIPPELPYLFMISGGTLAVENALKAAFDWKVRKNLALGHKEERGYRIIHFREAFHGRSGYTLSLTNTDYRKIKYFPKFDWPRIINPKIVFPINAATHAETVALEKQAVTEIETAIHRYRDDIAAIIIEPIQGEGGDNHFRKEFFQKLRSIADENDIMLIFDEVQTGLGLTGRMWCYQALQVVPDMLVFGKKTQVCGFLCSRRIDEVDNNVFHESSRINSTWGGNLVDMVRARKYLEIIIAEDLIPKSKKVGEYFLGELLELAYDFPESMCAVRGRGLMIAFDMATTEARTLLLAKLYENGLIALGCGENSIRFRPSLTFTSDLVDEALRILRQSLQDMSK